MMAGMKISRYPSLRSHVHCSVHLNINSWYAILLIGKLTNVLLFNIGFKTATINASPFVRTFIACKKLERLIEILSYRTNRELSTCATEELKCVSLRLVPNRDSSMRET